LADLSQTFLSQTIDLKSLNHLTMSDGRIAVVTGANKGIGYYIAQQLCASNKFSRVILACRDQGRGDAAVAKLNHPAAEVYAPLELGDSASIDKFVEHMKSKVGRCDVLVNNAALAFKGADPTPFEGQTEPTLRVNYWGTVRLTDGLLDLIRRTGQNPQVVTVASLAGHLGQVARFLQEQFSSSSLTREKLNALVTKFASDVASGQHRDQGWSSSNYGTSKLAMIAYTKMVAREEANLGSNVKVNCCCPGYCATDMSSHRGSRHAADGAKNASMIALQAEGPNALNGEFIQNEAVSSW
jgi:carbonyl reductase 1